MPGIATTAWSRPPETQPPSGSAASAVTSPACADHRLASEHVAVDHALTLPAPSPTSTACPAATLRIRRCAIPSCLSEVRRRRANATGVAALVTRRRRP
ncbi:hypothetical protein WMF45_28645 [Sorangium sp. So ce448]|uniref:hypothetical protein n=1 Tax=Sorangium sp. So ce448 TaxID=3133314 RepID=UPI003F5DC761